MRGGPLVVVGDALLDVHVEGSADRLAPDAPVPVVDCEREHHRAGGAGLAATLAAGTSGHDVILVTALGDDRAGDRLRELLAGRVELVRLPMRGATACKIWVRAGGQSLVRLDTGDGRAAAGPIDPRVEAVLRRAGTVLVSDYGRGVAAHPELRRILSALPGGVPIAWDPHPRGPAPVSRARLVMPNRAEARAFAGDEPAGDDGVFAQAARDAAALLRRWRVGGVAVTLGEQGALLSVGDGVPFVAPAPETAVRSQADTCGAGDCFAAVTAHVLHGGGLLTEAVTEAVRRAGAFVAAGGAAAVRGAVVGACSGGRDAARPGGTHADGNRPWVVVRRVRERGGRVVATGGCFDLLHAGHVSMLREARRLGDCLIVCLNSDASVRALKGPDRPLVPAEDRARVLAALECVDAVAIFDELTPVALLDRLWPDVWVKGADHSAVDLVEADTVRRHGGEVVLLPYLGGRSTSGLVARARQTASAGGDT
jgi:rfaE bifunctional protein nucleotidyltransferase chain/domain/rfaE bifunctional protein kinase chain/domain